MAWAVLGSGYFPRHRAELGCSTWGPGLVLQEASAGSQDIGSKSGFAEPPVTAVGPALYWLAIAFVVVAFGNWTQRMHIFHESHVPSQQT